MQSTLSVQEILPDITLNRLLNDTDFLMQEIKSCLKFNVDRKVRKVMNIIEFKYGLDLDSNERQQLAKRILVQLQKLESNREVQRTYYGWRLR